MSKPPGTDAPKHGVQRVGRTTRPRVVPLKWKTHHVKDKGWYGVTATGYEVCHVYQPWDNRIRRGQMPWQVFSYFGGKDNPLTGTARFGKFKTAVQAKRAAQKWWNEKMLTMLVGGGAEHGRSRRAKNSD